MLILPLLGHGWRMTHLAPRPDRLVHYAGHPAMGYDLLALLVLRLLWRWFNAVPDLPPDTARWERFVAHAGHAGLYALMFATTLIGWALSGTVRAPYVSDLFGLWIPPMYVSSDRAMHRLLEDMHMWLAYLLAVLIAVHVLVALRHYFVKRNDVLRRMIARG